MAAVVVFDYATWVKRYPEFLPAVTEPLAQMYFNEAQQYCDNTDMSVVPAGSPSYQRDTFLNMITAHIAALNSGTNGNPPSGLVGRIESAAEGTVNVGVKLEGENQARAYWAQTQYGLAYWQASAQYRTMIYAAAPPYNFGRVYPGRGYR